MTTPTRCGFVALIGAPNAGKSTLLNQLVGQKVAIVTHKVQTTRTRITGIALDGAAQLVFLDTPGIFQPKRRLDRAMVSAAWEGAGDADMVVLLVDAAAGVTDEVQAILDRLADSDRRVVLALNKIDRIRRDSLLALSQRLFDTGLIDAVFMISALTGDGVEDLKHHLAGRAPEGPWHYPEDQVTDVTQRLLAAEITREKVYLRLHQELPYAVTVETEDWQDRADGSVRIEQVIHVTRDTHKGIVIGKGGRTLKALGEAARADLGALLERPVHLFLHVRVTPDWADKRDHYRDMGLDWVE
ncbi:GTPase Era [Rhodothalassium salexigens]|uniref:GTPase Era n=1 Tax=Rhodothalassium salexigens TaxID=1086 RepID=UPI001913E273|nr:GTPase Era [Rhodothalassium salexigens]MBK5912303.1 GTPase Era [Rhodothalassium salexigens]MBK5920276.1 GTPase Era [Rhodothalassium salexigens]